jgi:plasmid stability protein
MPNVLVREIPDDVHAALQRRAERRGQSLQQYLAGELKRLAEKPSLEDVLDALETHTGGAVGFAQAAEDLAAERSAG